MLKKFCSICGPYQLQLVLCVAPHSVNVSYATGEIQTAARGLLRLDVIVLVLRCFKQCLLELLTEVVFFVAIGVQQWGFLQQSTAMTIKDPAI